MPTKSVLYKQRKYLKSFCYKVHKDLIVCTETQLVYEYDRELIEVQPSANMPMTRSAAN